MTLTSFTYGKGRVRVMRVDRSSAIQQVSELSIDVMLHGDFARAYTDADNHGVIATDSIRNIVNITAGQHLSAEPEALCGLIATSFLARYAQVSRVQVASRETRWQRLSVAKQPHPHSFLLDGNGSPTASVDATRDATTVQSGIAGFTFLKSTGSGWADYLMDEVTTLQPTHDRIAATSMDAVWSWASPADYTRVNATILTTMLGVFADTYSHSLQDSLFRMGEAALATAPALATVTLSCPNKHYLPVNLSAFGGAGQGCVFTATDEPHGQIECTVAR